MATQLRLPTLLLAALSLSLNVAIIGTAGRTLHVFDTNKTENVYFLPVWNSHFDMRGLHALIGTSAVIVVLNAILALALFISVFPANALVLSSSALSTTVAIVAIAFQAALNHNAPYRDTLQTWTCAWRNVQGQGVPRSFDTLCNETRFAFYTTIPSLLIQLTLLSLAVYALTARKAWAAQKRSSAMRLEGEKDYELGVQQQQQALDAIAKEGGVRRGPDDKVVVRILAGEK